MTLQPFKSLGHGLHSRNGHTMAHEPCFGQWPPCPGRVHHTGTLLALFSRQLSISRTHTHRAQSFLFLSHFSPRICYFFILALLAKDLTSPQRGYRFSQNRTKLPLQNVSSPLCMPREVLSPGTICPAPPHLFLATFVVLTGLAKQRPDSLPDLCPLRNFGSVFCPPPIGMIQLLVTRRQEATLYKALVPDITVWPVTITDVPSTQTLLKKCTQKCICEILLIQKNNKAWLI